MWLCVSLQVLQPSSMTRSVSRPLELTRTPSVVTAGGEAESLRRELEAMRWKQEALEEEAGRLQSELSHKTKECEELAASHDATKREADVQVRQLEEALGDVQTRMLDSEAKVKQLQAHVVAVKEHLSSQLVEDLKVQLGDVKAKYEGASAEVCRVRNHLKLSEKALEEYKKSEGQLAVEAERLTQELNVLKEEREDMAETLLDMEAHVKDVEIRLASMVPSEKFDNMKNLLTNAVDEKEKQLAELREDYDRVLEEVAELHREMDNRSGPGAMNVPLQEHERVRTALEEQSMSLKRKLADVTAKSQALIQEVEESEEEREVLREQLEDLKEQMQSEFVPLESHEDLKRSLGRAVDDLKEKLGEAVEQKELAESELRRLQEEKASLCENVTLLQSTHVSSSQRLESEVGTLSARNAALEKELESVAQKCEERERELREALAEKEKLERSLQGRVEAREEYERAKAELSAALQESKDHVSTLEKDSEAKEAELQKVKEGSAMLKEELEKVQTALEKDYISLGDHEIVRGKLSSALAEAEERAQDALSKYQTAQADTAKLHKEIEEQKRELDTIQEAIQVKFVPLSVVQEKESGFEAALKDLTEQLSGMQEKYDQEKAESERRKLETERLEADLQEALRRLEADLESSSERLREAEDEQKGRSEELSLKLVDLEQQYKEVTVQRAELEEQNALCATEIQALQRRLEVEYVRLERFEAMQQALTTSLQQAQEQCQQAQVAQRHEAERARQLEQELQARDGTVSSAILAAEQEEARGALEREVAQLRLALREEEEAGAQRAEDVAALQSELLRATQALEELRGREEGEVAALRLHKQRLEEEVQELGERLSGLAEQYEELYRETGTRRDAETQARAEADSLQAKSAAIEGEIRELKERYDDSLHTIGELQKRIQMSSEQTEAKDKRVREPPLLTVSSAELWTVPHLALITFDTRNWPCRQGRCQL